MGLIHNLGGAACNLPCCSSQAVEQLAFSRRRRNCRGGLWLKLWNQELPWQQAKRMGDGIKLLERGRVLAMEDAANSALIDASATAQSRLAM